MAKLKPQNTDPVVEMPVRSAVNPRVIEAVQWLGAALLFLSIVAMLLPDWRLWAVHQFAFLHPAVAVPILALAALLLSPIGVRLVSLPVFAKFDFNPLAWSAIAFALFMIFSVRGSLLGDGQLSLTRLAHVGDMIESHEKIPPGRFFSQKEPGTMLLHEGAFRAGMALFGPDIAVEKGRAGQQARVERQLVYRDIAQWCYRILSCLAGALLLLVLLKFVRARNSLNGGLFMLVLLTCGGWLAFFGYVENYAWVGLAMMIFLVAGLRATEPPRTIPILPILLFGIAVLMHYMAIVLFPALVYLLWTLHFEPRDHEQQKITAPNLRLKIIIASFVVAGIAGYIYVKGWRGWISVLPLWPDSVEDGYALLSLKHGVDLVNLLLWSCVAALVILLVSRRTAPSIRTNNQENFLLLAAGASAVFAFTFSPNLGMARDWDIVSAAMWPTVFYGAWRTANYQYDAVQLLRLRANLVAIILLILVPAVLVQTNQSTAIARFRNLLELDRSRSSYGWENLALYYQRTGELDLRIAAWEKAGSVGRNPRYLFNLAEAYKLADRMDEADQAALSAAQLNKDFAENLFYYAVAQAKRDKLYRARTLVNSALEINPSVAFGQKMKWWIDHAIEVDSLAKSGDLAAARMRLSTYAQQDSTNSYWQEYALKLGR